MNIVPAISISALNFSHFVHVQSSLLIRWGERFFERPVTIRTASNGDRISQMQITGKPYSKALKIPLV
jgi:hypothetical protein